MSGELLWQIYLIGCVIGFIIALCSGIYGVWNGADITWGTMFVFICLCLFGFVALALVGIALLVIVLNEYGDDVVIPGRKKKRDRREEAEDAR